MPKMLLRTKLFVPPTRPNQVPRPHLINLLIEGVQSGRKLTLISAPAGSGKTTLLSQFVARLQRPAAWLSLDESDDDSGRFWTYLITACQSVRAGVGQSALALLEGPPTFPDDTIPTMLINDFVNQDENWVLILDDVHLIRHPSIHESLAFLIDHLPPNLHLVVSTRIDPPWPLPRYRAHSQLIEIRAHDLRFSEEETAVFFNQSMELNLSPEDVAALEARTEGWASGLQLAAVAIQSLLARQSDADVAAFVQAFTGSHRYVADYLLDEVLQRRPEAVQTFLLQTAVLQRLRADLCNAVTGREDGQAMLAALFRANLFVIPLDAAGQWYRYHHLFADLLRARLSQTLPQETVTRLHLRAAAWYERHDFIDDAVRHALAAEAYEQAAALVEREARALMFSGRASTLRGWLTALPQTSFQAHPRLRIYRQWIDLMQERSALSAQFLRDTEAQLHALPPSPENEQLRTELTAVLCRFVAFAGDTTRAIRLAEEALARLPEGEKALRARAHSALAIAHWIEGQAEKAGRAHEACIRLAQTTGNHTLAAHASMMWAMSQTDYGQLHAAAATYRSIIELGTQAGLKIFLPAGQGYIGLAGVHLEWNERETAAAYLQQGMELCRQGGLAGLSTAHAVAARLRQAEGDFPAALAALAQLGETGVDPTGTARHILLSIAMDDLARATRLAGPWMDLLQSENTEPQPPLLIMEIIKVTLAHLHLALGELAQARRLLDEVAATAVPAHRAGRLIELYLLQALVQQEEDNGAVSTAAVATFERALALAASQGYTLLFLEAGTAVVPLLQAVAGQQENPLQPYAQRLLAAFRQHAATISQPGEAAGLVEPLTPREMEVLHRIAAGDSNRAIANALVITVRTVKKHAGNIYGKLNVSSRTQAVARARELGLLSPEA